MEKGNRLNCRVPAGHTLAEYGIIGALVILIAIPAVILLGQNISAYYSQSGSRAAQAQGLFSLLSSGGSGSNGSPATGDGAGTTGDGSSGNLGDLPDAGGLGGTGTAIMSSSVNGQEEFVRLIEEHGAGYVTSQLLSDLDQTINAMEDSGEINAEQAALLRQLSRQGHRIAGIEGLLSESFATGQTEGLMLDGQTYSRRDLLNIIGYTSYNPANWNNNILLDAGSGYAMPENQAFLDAYAAAMSSIDDNPELQQWVSGLSGEILLLTESVEDTTMGSMEQSVSNSYNAFVASTITHYDSNLFCNAGSGNATGTSCGG